METVATTNAEQEISRLIATHLQGLGVERVYTGDSTDRKTIPCVGIVVRQGAADPPRSNCHTYDVAIIARAHNEEELAAISNTVQNLTTVQMALAIESENTFSVLDVEIADGNASDTDRTRAYSINATAWAIDLRAT